MAALALSNLTLVSDARELPTVVIGSGLTIDYANDSAHEVLGHTVGALVGQSGALLWPATRRNELGHVQAVLSGQRSRRVRTTALRSDGQLMDVEMCFDPWLDAQRRVRGVVVGITRLRPSRSVPPPLPRRAPQTLPPVANIALASRPKGRASSAPQLPPAPSLRAQNTGTRRSAQSETNDSRVHLRQQLDTALQLMRWLDSELNQAPSSRDRARMRVVLEDARGVVADCLRRLSR